MVARKNNGDEYDWIEKVVKAGQVIGLKPVPLRWKLRRLQDNIAKRKLGMQSRAGAVVRKHKTCPKCRAINSIDEKTCSKCGAKLHSREVEVAARFLRHFDIGLTAETILVVAYVTVYLLEVVRARGFELWGGNSFDLIAMGGNSLIALFDGQLSVMSVSEFFRSRWYTLLTSTFIHIGMLHLLFNAYGLMYVAPFARRIFNSSKVMVVYILSGIGASVVSVLWRSREPLMAYSVSAGASGALCGLIGLMVAWGHRDGTFSGHTIRNNMARWVFYTLLYGYFIGADNAAHIGGLAVGVVMAYLLPEDFDRPETTPWRVTGALCWLAVIAAVGVITYLAFTASQIPMPGLQ